MTGRGLPMVALGTAGVAGLIAVAVHPVIGLALLLAPLGAMVISRHELAALQAFAFLICLVPSYFRLPGLSFIHPTAFLLLPLAAVVVLRLALRPELPLWSPMHSLAACYLALVLVSMINPFTSGETLRELAYVIVMPLCGFLVTFHGLRERRHIHRLLDVLVASATVAAIYGIVEFVAGRNWLIEGFLLGQPGFEALYFRKEELLDIAVYRVFSTSINGIEFATFTGMLLPYAVLGVVREESRGRRRAYAVATLLMLLGVALTFSRGASIAVLVMLGIAIVCERRLRKLVPPALVLAAAALVLALIYPEQILTRAKDTDTITTRLGLYRLALLMVSEHPLLGVGFGNFKNHVVAYADRFGAVGFEFDVARFTLAENTYMEILSELGPPGLLIHLAIVGMLLVRGARLARAGVPDGWRAGALSLGVGVYAFNGLGSGSVIVFMMATQLFWVMAALIARLDIAATDHPRETAAAPAAFPVAAPPGG